MKTIITKIRAAWDKLPASAQSALRALVTTFAAVFVGVAAPLLPAIIDSLPYVGNTPDFTATKALTIAAITAGVAAAIRAVAPLVKDYTIALCVWAFKRLTPPAK
jgi:hypothetical protein